MFNDLVIGFEEDRFWKFEALMVPIFLLYGDSEILFGQLVTNNAIKKSQWEWCRKLKCLAGIVFDSSD